MAYKLLTTHQFEKDLKRCKKRGLPMDKLKEVINELPMRAVWELPMRAIDTTNKKNYRNSIYYYKFEKQLLSFLTFAVANCFSTHYKQSSNDRSDSKINFVCEAC